MYDGLVYAAASYAHVGGFPTIIVSRRQTIPAMAAATGLPCGHAGTAQASPRTGMTSAPLSSTITRHLCHRAPR